MLQWECDNWKKKTALSTMPSSSLYPTKEIHKYNEQPKYYDNLPNMMLLLKLPLKHHWLSKDITRPLKVFCDMWYQHVYNIPQNTYKVVLWLLIPVSCIVKPPWTRLLAPNKPHMLAHLLKEDTAMQNTTVMKGWTWSTMSKQVVGIKVWSTRITGPSVSQ